MAVAITESVGKGGKNKEADVRAVQLLLNKWITPHLTVNGTCDGTDADLTVVNIKKYQEAFMKTPDGNIGRTGFTLKSLNVEWTQLPQTFGLGPGYYQYGKSSDIGARQWGEDTTIKTLTDVSLAFQQIQLLGAAYPFVMRLPTDFPPTLVGIGDVSFKFGGKMDPHGTHREGKHVDLRPCRKDKAQSPVTYTDTANYDQAKTKLLIELFLANSNVKSILFNDPEIIKLKGVQKWDKHDDHFHITMKD